MQTSTFGFVHIGLAAGAVLFCVGATDITLLQTTAGLAAGFVLGSRAGGVTGRALEQRLDRGGGIVLYAEDAAPYALLWPFSVLVLSPLAFGATLFVVIRSPVLQTISEAALCGAAAAWLAHDFVVARRIRRLSQAVGPLQVQWFHGRSVVGAEAMIGRIGTVTTPVAPSGYVRIGGELWRARSLDGAALGTGLRVRVRRLDGLVLLMEPADDPETPQAVRLPAVSSSRTSKSPG
jgi:membrane protein implicated in regulation of membrane protease activity